MSFNSPDSLRVVCVRVIRGTESFVISDSEIPLRLEEDGNDLVTTVFDRSLLVEPITHNGLLDPTTARLYMSNSLQFLDELSNGRAALETKMVIFELSFDTLDGVNLNPEIIYWFRGVLGPLEVNPPGRSGQTALNLTSVKHSLERQVGVIAAADCTNKFGDLKTCLFDLPGSTVSSTATAIDGLSITIPGLPDRPSFWWERGTVAVAGLEVAIAQWLSGDVFILAQLPPKAWIDAMPALAVDLQPGCRLSVSDCTVFQQDERFNGLGLGMLKHHPQFERPL